MPPPSLVQYVLTDAVFHISDISFRHHSHLRNQYKLVSVHYWMYVPFSGPYLEIIATSK